MRLDLFIQLLASLSILMISFTYQWKKFMCSMLLKRSKTTYEISPTPTALESAYLKASSSQNKAQKTTANSTWVELTKLSKKNNSLNSKKSNTQASSTSTSETTKSELSGMSPTSCFSNQMRSDTKFSNQSSSASPALSLNFSIFTPNAKPCKSWLSRTKTTGWTSLRLQFVTCSIGFIETCKVCMVVGAHLRWSRSGRTLTLCWQVFQVSEESSWILIYTRLRRFGISGRSWNRFLVRWVMIYWRKTKCQRGCLRLW